MCSILITILCSKDLKDMLKIEKNDKISIECAPSIWGLTAQWKNLKQKLQQHEQC